MRAMFTLDDHEFMQRALRLAEFGLTTTTPNPRVGCVLVHDNAIVGEGWHRRAGEPHAEVLALAQAGGRARGATAYVTLEPCNHHGRTPPCVDALLEAGVGRVIAAMEDPNPSVNGEGLERLRAGGVEVRCGLLEQRSARTEHRLRVATWCATGPGSGSRSPPASMAVPRCPTVAASGSPARRRAPTGTRGARAPARC